MRIGMMVDIYKPYISGVTHQVDLSKCVLEAAGHEVYVFTFGDPDTVDDEPNIIRSPGLPVPDTNIQLSLLYSRRAKEILHSMDIIHVHHPFLSGRLALHYCRSKSLPIVFTNHTRYDIYPHTYLPILPEDLGQKLLRAYMPDFCEAVDLVTVPSEGMKKILQDTGVTSHIEVIPNGLDLHLFKNAQPRPRAQFGYTDQDVLLIYTGRLAPEKNIPFLLQAFAGLAQAIPNVHLLIVGSGLKPFEDEVRAALATLELGQRVRMIGGVPYEEVPAYLAMCDLFVITSIAEAFGMATAEAMSAGLPIMGIRTTGTEDIVEDGRTGLLSSQDIAAYTAKLTYLCLNPALLKQMGAAARLASQQYDIERTTDSFIKQYERLLQNTRPLKLSLDERLLNILREFFGT